MTETTRDQRTGRSFTPDRTYAVYFPACGSLPARVEFRHGTYDWEGETFRTEAERAGCWLNLDGDRNRFLADLGYEVAPEHGMNGWWPDRIDGAWRAQVTETRETTP